MHLIRVYAPLQVMNIMFPEANQEVLKGAEIYGHFEINTGIPHYILPFQNNLL